MIENYGYLAAISASWNEQKTAPIVVCDNVSVVNRLAGDHTIPGQSSFIGAEIEHSYDNLEYGFCQKTAYGSGITYDITYNTGNHISAVRDLTCLAYMFYCEEIVDGEISVGANELISHIQKYDYADFLFADKVDSNRKKGQQTVDISIGETFDRRAATRDLHHRLSRTYLYDRIKRGIIL